MFGALFPPKTTQPATNRHKLFFRAVVSAIPVFLATPFCLMADTSSNAKDTASDTVKSHLEFVIDFGANCVSRSAKQVLIQNHHPSKSIKVKLFRFFGDVRQPGRASYVLAAGDEPLALGCDKIQGRAQRWDIHKAEFE